MASLRQIRQGLRVIPEVFDLQDPDSWESSAPFPSGSGSGSEGWNFDDDYLNPDEFYPGRGRPGNGAVTFIYIGDGRIYYGENSHTTHYQLVGQEPDLWRDRYDMRRWFKNPDFSKYLREFTGDQPQAPALKKRMCRFCHNTVPPGVSGVCPHCDHDPNFEDPALASEPTASSRNSDDGLDPRERAMAVGDLCGRVSGDKLSVSFWNEDRSDYQSLEDCLKRLIQDGHLLPAATVYTPMIGKATIDELGMATMVDLDPAAKEKMELYKKLHLMRGGQKQAAMKQLGLLGGGKPHPVQSAMDQAGLRVPGQKWWAPQSESFDSQFSTILEFQGRPERTAWLNPDLYFNTPEAIPFIYGNGVMVISHNDLEYHGAMLEKQGYKFGVKVPHGGAVSLRNWAIQQGWLLGRMGIAGRENADFNEDNDTGIPEDRPQDGSVIISFWNKKPADYAALRDCIAQIEASTADVMDVGPLYISTPVHGTVLWDGQEQQSKEMDPEEEEKYELFKKLHLMRGAEKQAAMKKLGVDGGGRPHPMQSALRDAGLNNPGQKWWAPHSESFDRQLGDILERV